ncbi:MAG: serine/threonine-protein kinase, partial [Gemmataceae bacterium]
MSTVEDLSERLLRWQERRERGEDVSADELCADRPELAGELRQRIAALQSMEQLLGVNGSTGDVDPRPAAGGEPVVPGYEILEEIDRGGMGVVYKARQIGLNRLVALKMIRGTSATAAQRDRFRSEAEAVAKLRHANIVQIFDIGEIDGRPYFSMELVEGGTLADRLSGTPLPVRAAAELIRTLAAAIHVAHEAGVVHRDLKPANVLLTGVRSQDSGVTKGNHPSARTPDSWLLTSKVTDFGLAKRLDTDDGPTISGAVLGTPSYMAPEQAEGRSRSVGPAADIYALGAILYECLTGRPPFRAETALETLDQVRSYEPVRPRELQPKVPRDLETICLKCLQKSPRRRYDTAAELGDDLGRYLTGEPIRARPVSLFTRGVIWTRKRPAVASLSLVALVALAALLGGWAHFTAKLHDERELARNDQIRAENQEKLAVARLKEAERQKTRAEALMRAACQTIDENAWAMVSRKGEVVRELAPGGVLYNVARVNALAAATVRDDPLLEPADRDRVSEQYAQRAVEMLDKANDAGYFQSRPRRERLSAEPDLAALQGRDDFRAFVRQVQH